MVLFQKNPTLKDTLVIRNCGDHMSENILKHVKTFVDIATDDDTSYDDRLIDEIENVLGELNMLIPVKTYDITNDTSYEELVDENTPDIISLIKRFISISVRLSFDPPTGSVLTSLEKVKDNTASMITVLRSANAK